MLVGEIVKVGSALVDIKRLQTGAEALSNAAHAVADAGPATSTTPTCPHAGAGTYRGGAVLTTPAVRKIAKENNISDLKAVAEKYATGPKGRLLKDVRKKCLVFAMMIPRNKELASCTVLSLYVSVVYCCCMVVAVVLIVWMDRMCVGLFVRVEICLYLLLLRHPRLRRWSVVLQMMRSLVEWNHPQPLKCVVFNG